MADYIKDQIEAVRNSILGDSVPVSPIPLTADQAVIWHRIFSTTEPGWISENQYGLVVAMCRHEDAMNKFSHIRNQMFEAMEDEVCSSETNKDIDRLSKMIERETRSYSSIATRLRLTTQSVRSADVKRPSIKAAPWEITASLMVEDSDNESDI